MTILAYVIGVLILGLGIGFSIAWHELGHLLPAKRFGVRVPKYMIGFGPTVWSRRRGDTEYGLKLLPFGGFIQMIGMFPPRKGDAEDTVRVSSTGRFSQLVDEARASSLEDVRPGDENRVFYKLPVRKKIAVMLGGPLMNLILGVGLLGALVTVHGIPTEKPGAEIQTVRECVTTAAEAAKGRTDCAGLQQTPAWAARLQPRDRILAINGTALRTNEDVSRIVRPRAGTATDFLIERAGRTFTVRITPIRSELPVYDRTTGQVRLDASGKEVTEQAGFLGVATSGVVVVEPQPVSAVVPIAWDALSRTMVGVVRIPEKMAGVADAAFGGGARAADSPQSLVGVGRIAGDAASGKLDAWIGTNTADRAWFLVSILASLNFMLFVFNLIPLLPLDGGHVAGALWEAVKRTGARLLGRDDPGPVDVAKAMPLAYGVSLVLIAMTAVLMYADIVNPVRLGG